MGFGLDRYETPAVTRQMDREVAPRKELKKFFNE